MKQRLLVAAVGVPLLIVVLVLLPPIATAILTAAIAGAAAWELLHTACRQPKLLYVPTVLCEALVVLAIVFGTAITATLIYAFFYVMFLFYMAVSTHGKETAIPFADVAVCIVAGFLFPAMYSCIGLLRNVAGFLRGEEEIVIKKEETLNVTAIIEAFYTSAEEHREILCSDIVR